jgi:hypothetical protein
MIKDYSKVPRTFSVTNNTGADKEIDLRFIKLVVKNEETISVKVEVSEHLALFTARANELGLELGEPATEVTDEASMKEALVDENVKEVVLSADLELAEALVPTHDITIDGNGKTITSTKRIANAEGVTVELKNVNVNVTEDTAVRASKGGKVIIGSDAKITNTKGWGVTAFEEGTTVEINGTIETGSEPCIAGNGSAGKGNTNIVINEGAKLVSDDITIFIPQDGTVTINGGEIVGKTAIGIKAGTLNINGGTLTANGEKVETPKANNNGMAAWGDTIAIEVNKGYAGGKTDKNIKVNVSDKAVLTSANAEVIREFNPLKETISTEVTGAYANKEEVAENIFVYTK